MELDLNKPVGVAFYNSRNLRVVFFLVVDRTTLNIR